jgi:hypothetical protein|tara:strand:+ start:527 stop:2338 length:1812 start_codon:yes stop_codon:yes gene_type:complete
MQLEYFDRKKRNELYIVFLLSGFFGYCIAVINHATWQGDVTSAQVISGIVEYPPNNPLYIRQIKVWSLLNQFSAVLLYSGISEKTASIIVCGLLGGVSFQALALIVFAFSLNSILAVLSPFFIYFMNYVGYSIAYPIILMGTEFSHGIIGLSFILLLIALIGNGQYKLAGLFLGIAPAIHPSLGAFCVLAAGITFLWDYGNNRENLKKLFKYFLIGCLITAISLAYQLYLIRDLQNLDRLEAQKYLSSYIKYWDYHRQPIKLWSYGILTCIASLLLSIFALLYLKKELPQHSLFLLKLFIVSAILSIALGLTTLLPPEIIPSILLTLMPGRFQNLNNLVFVVLLIGILGNNNFKNFFFHRIILFAFVICSLFLMIIAYNLDLPRYSKLFNQSKLLLPFAATICLTVISLTSNKLQWFLNSNTSRQFINSIHLITLIVFVFMGITAFSKFGHTVLAKYNGWKVEKETFRDWTNDPLYAEISKGKGLLLTAADITLVQLYTRRPVLFDGVWLDGFAYVPESGPELNKILRQVYGFDLLKPPPEKYRNRGAIPKIHKDLWEHRTLKQWRDIKKRYGVFDILTHSDWNLNLPIVIQNEKYMLYYIDD